jgi:hypothetical protein
MNSMMKYCIMHKYVCKHVKTVLILTYSLTYSHRCLILSTSSAVIPHACTLRYHHTGFQKYNPNLPATIENTLPKRQAVYFTHVTPVCYIACGREVTIFPEPCWHIQDVIGPTWTRSGCIMMSLRTSLGGSTSFRDRP